MNPARQLYAKALSDLNGRSKPKAEPKTGGLLQRNKSPMAQKETWVWTIQRKTQINSVMHTSIRL